MSLISDRLSSLGAKPGSGLTQPAEIEARIPPDFQPTSQLARFPIEEIVSGHEEVTPNGATYVVHRYYDVHELHGHASLIPANGWHRLARWAGDPDLADLPREALAFLDTETTGLAVGVGTYTFMVGVSRFEGDHLHLAQYFLRSPLEEPAMLLAIERFLSSCQVLVTFNGKSFDAPLLNIRYTLHGKQSHLQEIAHIDLLYLARRLYRDRLSNRKLGTLEAELLNVHRSQDEVPSWMIPQMYFDYLRSGDARPMQRVFYHNAIDLISMPALMAWMADTLEDPLQENIGRISHHEYPALGRLFEDLQEIDLAMNLYLRGLEGGLPDLLFWEILERLSFLHKRRGEYAKALDLWKKAARHGFFYAHEELAKIYEHTLNNVEEALLWTQAALERLAEPSCPTYASNEWRSQFEHRKARLLKKMDRVV
jgi:hypothetical protein